MTDRRVRQEAPALPRRDLPEADPPVPALPELPEVDLRGQGLLHRQELREADLREQDPLQALRQELREADLQEQPVLMAQDLHSLREQDLLQARDPLQAHRQELPEAGLLLQQMATVWKDRREPMWRREI